MNSVNTREYVEDLSQVDDLDLYLEGRREAIRRGIHGPHPHFAEVHPYCRPTALEMHLWDHETSLPKRFGKAIKKTGGEYSHCREQGSKRYVNLPLVGNEELIRELFSSYRVETLIWRGGGMINRMMAWALVCSFSRDKRLKEAEDKLDACVQLFHKQYQESLQRDILNPSKTELERIEKAKRERNQLYSENQFFQALESLSTDSTLQDIVAMARWSREVGRSADFVDALSELDTKPVKP